MDRISIGNSQQVLEAANSRRAQAKEIFPSPGSQVDGGKNFAETLKDAVKGVNELQKDSDKAIENLATGRTDNVADVMIAAEKADIALKLMVQVRNKIIDAYQEIMKMQV